jgi:import inner membrane translocase subunit TIM16
MQLEEARQILNLKDPKEGIEPNEVSEVTYCFSSTDISCSIVRISRRIKFSVCPYAMQSFVRLFKNNDVEKGGSFYLQSKIYRAKEALEAEMQERGVQFTPAEIPMPEPKPEESASESEEKK